MRAIPRGGIALAYGARSLSSLDPSRDREGLTASLWQQWNRSRWNVDIRTRPVYGSEMQFFTRTIQRVDSIRVDSAPGGWIRYNRAVTIDDSIATRQRASTLEIRTRWQRQVGRAALDLTFGSTGVLVPRAAIDTSLRLSRSASTSGQSFQTQVWARADAGLAIGSRLTLLMSAAMLPSQPFTNEGRSRVATIGLSWLTARPSHAPEVTTTGDRAPAVSIQRIDNDSLPLASANDTSDSDSITVRIRIRPPRATRVEIAGEQFQWHPIDMQSVAGGWWELIVRVRPGTYRMSMRVDGSRWTSLPGLPVLHDEFGGDIAIVTFR